MLAGANTVLLSRFQSVLNAAARLVFSANRSAHTTPLFQELYWLRVPERIQFRNIVSSLPSNHLRLRNDLYWGVKLYSLTHSPSNHQQNTHVYVYFNDIWIQHLFKQFPQYSINLNSSSIIWILLSTLFRFNFTADHTHHKYKQRRAKLIASGLLHYLPPVKVRATVLTLNVFAA